MRRLLSRRGQQGKWEWASRMTTTVLALSCLIALPALSWYAAMPLTAVTGELLTEAALASSLTFVTDITALYNCFAFVSRTFVLL